MAIKIFRIILLLLVSTSFAMSSTKINKIAFCGNKSFGNRKLKSNIGIMETSLFHPKQKWDNINKRLLKQDLSSLRNFYRTHGFLDVVIKDSVVTNQKGVNIFIVVNEGQQYLWNQIIAIGNTVFSDKMIKSVIPAHKGTPINLLDIRSSIKQLIQMYQNTGKPEIAIRDSVGNENLYLFFNEGEFKGSIQDFYPIDQKKQLISLIMER